MQSRFSFTGLYRHVFPRYEYTESYTKIGKSDRKARKHSFESENQDNFNLVCDQEFPGACIVTAEPSHNPCHVVDHRVLFSHATYGGTRQDMRKDEVVSDQELKRYKRRLKRKKYRQRKHLRKLMEDQNLEINVENDYMEREKELCETFMQNMRTNTDNFLDKIPNATDEQLGLLLEQNAFIIQTYNRIRSRLMNEKISRLGTQFEREVLTQSDDEKENIPENVPETIPEETV